jgi:hypothetical protein
MRATRTICQYTMDTATPAMSIIPPKITLNKGLLLVKNFFISRYKIAFVDKTLTITPHEFIVAQH